jgi:hypothetical protein
VQVHVHPAVPDDLPPDVGAAVIARDTDLGVYYSRDLDLPVDQRCAYADAALTAGFREALARLAPRLREA